MTRNHFKESMSLLANGVSILTCHNDGQNFGITISSLTSVGLNPPTVLVCVEGKSHLVEHIRKSRTFGVTILRNTQKDIGLRFSDPNISYSDRFKTTSHETINDCPLIEGGLAKMSCDVEQEVAVSGNFVFLGRVNYVESHEGKPLIYFHRNWRALADS